MHIQHRKFANHKLLFLTKKLILSQQKTNKKMLTKTLISSKSKNYSSYGRANARKKKLHANVEVFEKETAVNRKVRRGQVTFLGEVKRGGGTGLGRAKK